MGFKVDLMGFKVDLMGFKVDLMGFKGGLMDVRWFTISSLEVKAFQVQYAHLPKIKGSIKKVQAFCKLTQQNLIAANIQAIRLC